MENQQDIQEDEINLREYIKVIIKRKKLIFAIFLVSVIIAAIVNLRMPNVYEVASTIQLGNINGLLIPKEDVKAIILNQNSLLSIIKELNLKVEVKNLKESIGLEDVGDTGLLKIKVKYPDVETGIKIINAIMDSFLAYGQNIYQQRAAIIQQRLKELDAEISSAHEAILKTQALISGLPNSNNIAQSDVYLKIILTNNLPDYETNLSRLRNQRDDQELVLVNAKDFKIFDAPIKPQNPIGPNKKQNVLITGISALIFGVLLVFCMEFWQRSKKGKVK